MRTLLRGILFGMLFLALTGPGTEAQQRKPMRFWNLTLGTIVHLQLSPAGKNAWGEDQCRNDRDGTVDHDERLPITGVEPGRYDVKLTDKGGRVCVVKDIEVKEAAVFTIEEGQLDGCTR